LSIDFRFRRATEGGTYAEKCGGLEVECAKQMRPKESGWGFALEITGICFCADGGDETPSLTKAKPRNIKIRRM
jgi:hypothetical protein